MPQVTVLGRYDGPGIRHKYNVGKYSTRRILGRDVPYDEPLDLSGFGQEQSLPAETAPPDKPKKNGKEEGLKIVVFGKINWAKLAIGAAASGVISFAVGKLLQKIFAKEK